MMSEIDSKLPGSNPKSPPERNPDHLAFIRCLPCLYCGRRGQSVAAHVRSMTDGGMGMKPSDRFTVPLCDSDHRHQHQIGEERFWREVGLEIEDVLAVALGLWDVTGSRQRGETFLGNKRRQIEAFSLFGFD